MNMSQERVDDNDSPPHDYYNEGPPPSGDPDWGPPDAYGFDWSGDDERHVSNYQWSVKLDLRTWNCRGRVRARVSVIDESSLADYENEINIDREIRHGYDGYGGCAGKPSSAHTAAGARTAAGEPSSAHTAAGEPSSARTAAGKPSSAHTAAGEPSNARTTTGEPFVREEQRVRRQHVREEQLAREQQAGLPPHRRDEAYDHKAGSAHFRSDRAKWYNAFTGKPLVGSIAEQNDCFDVIARRFRKYPAVQHTAPSSAGTAASALSSVHTAAGEPSSVRTAPQIPSPAELAAAQEARRVAELATAYADTAACAVAAADAAEYPLGFPVWNEECNEWREEPPALQPLDVQPDSERTQEEREWARAAMTRYTANKERIMAAARQLRV
jgi:hypothetical protein